MQPKGPKSPYITIIPLFLWLILTSTDEFKFVQIFGIKFGDTLFTIVSRLDRDEESKNGGSYRSLLLHVTTLII